jgi:hypothetical protein
MPTPCRILGVLDGNIQKQKELTPFKHAKIIAGAEFGHSPSEIAKVLKVPDSTVRTTLRVNPLRDEGKSRPRIGRPRSYDE